MLCYEKLYIRRKELSSLQSKNGLMENENENENENYSHLLRIEARIKPKIILQQKKEKALLLK